MSGRQNRDSTLTSPRQSTQSRHHHEKIVVLTGSKEYHRDENRRDFQRAFFVTLLECDKYLDQAFWETGRGFRSTETVRYCYLRRHRIYGSPGC